MRLKSRFAASIVFASVALPGLALAAPFVAENPRAGLRLSLESAGPGQVRGTLLYEGVELPVAGRVQPAEGGFVVQGFVLSEGERVPFSARRRGGAVLMEGDGERAELAVRQEGSLAGGGKVEDGPRPRATDEPRPAPGRTPEARAPRSGPMRTFAVRDPQMGGAVAYTFDVPKSWKAKGKIQWGGGKVKFPQLVVELESPEGIILEHLPTLFAPPNLAPPADVGAWLAQMVERTSPEIRNARVLRQARDRAREAAERQQVGDIGVTHHQIVLAFDKGGRAYESEVALGYQKLPAATLGGPPRFNWSLQFEYVASFPVELKVSGRPLAQKVLTSARPDPRWQAAAQAHIRQQQGRARQDDARVMAEIRANGRRISEASDARMESWRRREAIRDRGHERVIDGIRGETAWRRLDWGQVKLPSQYDHAYQTPNGDWVVSEQPIDDAELTPLEAE